MLPVQKTSTIYRSTRQNTRCRDGAKTKKAVRPGQYGRNDFLRYSFLPLIETDAALLQGRKRKEQSYFKSLENLSALYGFEPLPVDDKIYPLNIYRSHCHAQKMVQQKEPKAQLLIISLPHEPATLATIKTIDTSNTLYYIAIQSLFCMLHDNTVQVGANG